MTCPKSNISHISTSRALESLFICIGILFENFVTNEYEQEFAENVVYPAINKIQKEFALKPLIVPLLPLEQWPTKHWCCYPDIVEQEILTRGNLHAL